MYVFQLFDYYAGSRIILLVGFFECVAIAWIYGRYDHVITFVTCKYNNILFSESNSFH